MIIELQTLFEFRCELEELVTDRCGMQAENQRRLDRGESIAYTEDAFYQLKEQIMALRNKIVAISEK